MDPIASSSPTNDSRTTARTDASDLYTSDIKHVPIVATTEQPQHHPFLDPASNRSQADSFDARRSHIASLFAWRQEIMTLLVGASALAAIIGTLAWFSSKEQPTWKHSINLNTLIAILSTILRVCLLYGVEEALSQMKWLWFRRPRSLRHLEYFDAAARGPGGSLFVFFRLRRIDSVFIGCLVVILSVGIGPFTQQAIKAFPCTVPSTALRSSVQVANTNAYFDFPRIAAGSFDISMATKAAILQGLVDPTDERSSITPDCPTGNCTFDSYDGITHSSMAMCKKCLDVTRWLYEARPNEGSNMTVYGDSEKMNGSVEYNLFLPADKPLSEDMPYLWTSVGGAIVDNITTTSHMAYAPHVFLNATTLEGWDWLLASGDVDDSFRAAVQASVLNFSMITLTTDDCNWEPAQNPEYPGLSLYNITCPHPSLNASSYWNVVNVVSATCALYPCVKDYYGEVIDTKYKETVIRETPASRSPDDVAVSIASQTLFNDHCIINDRPITLENVSSLISPDRVLNSTFVEGKNVSVPHECFFEIPGTYIRGIQEFLSKSLSGGCTMPSTQSFTISSEPRTWRTVDCGDAWWLRSLYNNGNATFKTIDANMEAVAVAMTNELRRTGSAWDGTPLYVQGNVSRATVCTRFDWKWLSFPLALLVLTTLMLVIVGVKTLFDKQQTPIWKSSALPLLFTGTGIGMRGAQDRVEREADGTVVSLKKREDGGWEFVSQGDSREAAVTSGYDGSNASKAEARAVVRPVS